MEFKKNTYKNLVYKNLSESEWNLKKIHIKIIKSYNLTLKNL
jgi:hypothetical protein